MKRFISVGLSTLLLIALTANTVNAQKTSAEKKISYEQNAPNKTYNQLKPFNLVFLGYQGYLQDQGIPSYGSFISEYQHMRFNAQDLVKASIATNRLSPEKLNDRQYLNAVETELLAFRPD